MGSGLASAAADAYNWTPDSAPGGHALPLLLNRVCICVIRVICGEVLPGRERGDDFFEARIAAQRIPIGTETNIAVGWTCREFRESFQLLDRQVALASPRTDYGIN